MGAYATTQAEFIMLQPQRVRKEHTTAIMVARLALPRQQPNHNRLPWCTCDLTPVLPSSKTIYRANTLRNYALRRELLVSPLFLLLLLLLLLAGALLNLSETSSRAGGHTHVSPEERRPERGHTI